MERFNPDGARAHDVTCRPFYDLSARIIFGDDVVTKSLRYTTLRETLSDDEVATLGAEGAAWSEDQAVEEALQK